MGTASSRRAKLGAKRAAKRAAQQMQRQPAEQPAEQRQCAAYCCDPLGQRPSTELACGLHSMHSDCLESWQRARNDIGKAASCPLCRDDVGQAPPQQGRREALERLAQSNWDAMSATPEVAATMRLQRRVGEAGVSTADQAAMVRVLRALPIELVMDLASNRGPEDVQGAVVDALERAAGPGADGHAGGSVDPRVREIAAEALADGRLVAMFARYVVEPRAGQREGEDDEDDLDAATARRQELRARVAALQTVDGPRMLRILDMVVEADARGDARGDARDLVRQLVDREIDQPTAAFLVWAAVVGHGGDVDGVAAAMRALPAAERRRLGDSLMRGDDMRNVAPALAPASRTAASRLRYSASAMGDFAMVALGHPARYRPPAAVPAGEVYARGLQFRGDTSRNRDNVNTMVRAVQHRMITEHWTAERAVSAAQHPEQLAVLVLDIALATSADAAALTGLRGRIARLSIRRADELGGSLLRGDGLLGLAASAEAATMANRYATMQVTRQLVRAVIRAVQRAVGLPPDDLPDSDDPPDDPDYQ
jgi:hypothetical protein